MDVELRAVTEEEFDAFLRVDHTAFGHGPPDEEDAAEFRRLTELDRTRAVFEGGRVVGASAALSFELTLPGNATVPAAGITAVGVLPTHRRRGHLRRMMGALLDDAEARAEPVAILYASESLIYGRFGYGWASSHDAVEIDTRHGAFLRPPTATGRIELIDTDQVVKVLPGIHDRARRVQPGDINRPAPWWDALTRDPEKHRGGASQRFFAVREAPSGEADGYAVYRVKGEWEHGHAAGRVQAEEVVGLTPEAEVELWHFLASIDLTQVVAYRSRPVDDPLRWMLADPRRLRVTTTSDQLWVRMVDVAAALAARRYPVEGTLVLDVADEFRPSQAGRYELTGGPDGARCRRTSADADLTLSAADLGALYLGGVAASTLAAASRVVEHRPGALARADAMLAGRPVPFCRTGF